MEGATRKPPPGPTHLPMTTQKSLTRPALELRPRHEATTRPTQGIITRPNKNRPKKSARRQKLVVTKNKKKCSGGMGWTGMACW